MADLDSTKASQMVSITGVDSTGLETNPVGADANGNLQVVDKSNGPVVPGTAAQVATLVAGQYNTTLPTLSNTQQAALQTDINGRLIVSAELTDGYKPTYSASVIGLVFANTATDIFTIRGSASKTIKILRVGFIATQTTAAIRDIVLLKRSTANTGGISTNPTAVALDSTNPAATATVNAYTVNPIFLGTLVGNIRAYKAYINTTAATPNSYEWTFGVANDQAITLRGTAEVFSINMNSVTSAGNLCNIWIEWSEE